MIIVLNEDQLRALIKALSAESAHLTQHTAYCDHIGDADTGDMWQRWLSVTNTLLNFLKEPGVFVTITLPEGKHHDA